MKRHAGLSLIEMIIFIVIIGIIALSMMQTFRIVSANTVDVQKRSIATQSAARCLEWYLSNRYTQNYNSITCPSTTVPSFCTVPSGYTLSTNVTCIIKYGESVSNYKNITVTVGGTGSATLSLVIADY